MTPTIDDFRNKDNIQIKEEIVDGLAFYIVSYIYNDSALWKDPINLEGRGLTFDVNGNIVSRTMEKFFNINENQFTQLKDLDFEDAQYFEKVDGSMITGIIVNDNVHWKTKKSFYSEVAQSCQKDFGGINQYTNCVHICVNWDTGPWTPIFEYTSPGNRVVIDYGIEPKLTLLAIRHNVTGEYAPYEVLETFKFQGVPVVKRYSQKSIVDVLQEDSDNREGYVVLLKSGQRVKAKFPSYLSKHRSLDSFNARTIATMVIDETIDDMKPLWPVERLQIAEQIESIVVKEFDALRSVVYNLYKSWEGMELRDIGKQYSTHSQFHPAIQIFKGKDETKILKEHYMSLRVANFSTKQLW